MVTQDAGGSGVKPKTVTKTAANNGNGHALLPRTEQLAILSESLLRMGFGQTHGLQYNGDRDLFAVGGYPTALSFNDYLSMYERDGIAGQIVDMAPETTWRTPAEVVEEDQQEEGTEFTNAWSALVKRLRIWQRLERADRLSRIGRYSVLLIGTAGTDDKALPTPIQKVQGPEQILYFSAFHESHAKIDTWVTDPRDPRFGLPLTYKIDLSSGVDAFRSRFDSGLGTVIVHWSRVIHIAEGLLSDEVFGRPVLQRIWNDLHDLQKISTSTAEAHWQRVAGILTASIDPTTQVSDGDIDKLEEDLKEIYHDLRRTLVAKGVTVSRVAESEPNPEAADLYMTRIAAGAGYPKRILFGSETGERASTEDQKTYLGSISERQKQHAEPGILRPLIDRLISIGALPRPADGTYQCVWPPLFQESEKEIADANLARANAVKAITPMGGNPLDYCEIDEERKIWPRPTPERGELTEEELEAPEPPAPAGGIADPDAPGA
jgi:hypothetical protein